MCERIIGYGIAGVFEVDRRPRPDFCNLAAAGIVVLLFRTTGCCTDSPVNNADGDCGAVVGTNLWAVIR